MKAVASFPLESFGRSRNDKVRWMIFLVDVSALTWLGNWKAVQHAK